MTRQFSGKEHQRYKFCELCVHGFHDTILLEKHLNLCAEHEVVNNNMPKKNSTIEFKNWHKKFSVSLVIYADTEAVSFKYHTCRQNPDTS